MILIIANTVILATEKYPASEEDLIHKTNMVFIVLFTAECVIKLIGLTIE